MDAEPNDEAVLKAVRAVRMAAGGGKVYILNETDMNNIVLAERERCAKIAEHFAQQWDSPRGHEFNACIQVASRKGTKMSEKALAWIVGSDTGASSKALWAVMMGQKSDKSYPHDPADLGRCMRLLEAVPEWKPRVAEMASVSPYWKALSEHWQELETLLREETGLKQDWRGKATKTYDKMKAILDPLEKADRNVFRMGDGVTIRFGA